MAPISKTLIDFKPLAYGVGVFIFVPSFLDKPRPKYSRLGLFYLEFCIFVLGIVNERFRK